MGKANPMLNDGRCRNEIDILNFLQTYGPKPRIDIAEHIKMTKAAVTTITNDMIARGVLMERGEFLTEEQRHQRGRRKIMLDINENYQLVFGVVLERDFLHIGLTNLKGAVLDRIELNITDANYRQILEAIVEHLQQLIKNNCIPSAKLAGAGICLSKNGEMHIDGNTQEEKLNRLKKDLSHALSFPLITTPTAVGALVAQKLFADPQAEDMFLLRFGEIGECAIMTGGHIYRGFSKNAGGFHRFFQYLAGERFDLNFDDETYQNGSNTLLNEKIAMSLASCATVLDPEKIVGFGSYLEKEFTIPHINLFLESHFENHFILHPAYLQERDIFIAGCATAITCCFFFRCF